MALGLGAVGTSRHLTKLSNAKKKGCAGCKLVIIANRCQDHEMVKSCRTLFLKGSNASFVHITLISGKILPADEGDFLRRRIDLFSAT
jgi:hypothetical protein